MLDKPTLMPPADLPTRWMTLRWLKVALVLTALTLCGGCQNAQPGDEPGRDGSQFWKLNWLDQSTASAPGEDSADSSIAPSDEPTDANPSTPVAILSIDFQILRVRAAQGTFSRSAKIWNAIDEEILSPDAHVLLERNGLRVGAGQVADWPQIKAILDAEQVELQRDHQVVQNGLPLTVEVMPQMRDQLLFLFRPDGTMAGRSYGYSRTRLRIDYAISVMVADSVEAQVMPEIVLPTPEREQTLIPARRERYPVEEPTRPLWEIAVKTRIGPGEFLAVGPTEKVYEGHFAGTLLLVDEVDGRKLESVYFITPQIISRPLGPGS